RVLPGGMALERIAGTVEVDGIGQRNRQVAFRHWHDTAALAVDDRDRAAPVALARNAPVAQAEIDLARADRTIAMRCLLEPARDFPLRLRDRHAVEETRIDHASVAVVGGVGYDEGARV